MKTWTTENCTVYQVLRGRSNSFLVNSENNYILIDTGRKNSWKELSAKLDEILCENKVSCLILTHTHFDHVEKSSIFHSENKKFSHVEKISQKFVALKNQRFLEPQKIFDFLREFLEHVKNL